MPSGEPQDSPLPVYFNEVSLKSYVPPTTGEDTQPTPRWRKRHLISKPSLCSLPVTLHPQSNLSSDFKYHFCLAWNFGSMTSHSVTLGSGFIPSAFHLCDSSWHVGVDPPLTAVWHFALCVCVCLSYWQWALGWPRGRPWGMGRALGGSVWKLSCMDGCPLECREGEEGRAGPRPTS